MDSSLATSNANACAVPPVAVISAATSANLSRLRAASATDAPARANSRAHARPIPCEAPVTSAIRPVRMLMDLHRKQILPIIRIARGGFDQGFHGSSILRFTMSENEKKPAAGETDVYAIHGADPEVLAYAMAKYSRSSLTMKESLAEISSQRAEQFLNTFYFQYGHRSIADLAHIPFAIERLSLLAAIELVDEQRWDGQERSTRYQNFRRSGWFTPDLGVQTPAFTVAVEALFKAYDHVSAGMLTALKAAISQPESMKPDAYERTLKARAFDVARYLLPLATNTSLGQIVNARTLETQVSRLLTSEFAEVRQLGENLRVAATEPGWNVQHSAAQVLCDEIGSIDAACGDRAAEMLLRPVKTAPTLVKYATPNDYLRQTRSELAAAAGELMAGQPIAPAPVVDLLDDAEPLEVELATSLLYPHCHYSYRQLRGHVAALSAPQRGELIGLGAKHRGRHDELLRAFIGRHSLRLRVLMDIGWIARNGAA